MAWTALPGSTTLFLCCKGCEERYPSCHDTCETYQQRKAKRNKQLEAEHREAMMADVQIDRMVRIGVRHNRVYVDGV